MRKASVICRAVESPMTNSPRAFSSAFFLRTSLTIRSASPHEAGFSIRVLRLRPASR